MRIYLARHAQSQWQLAPSDDWDMPLSPTGHEQAKRLGQWLADHQKVDHSSRIEIASLCASPLRRAQETGAYAADALQLPLVTMQSLREADFHVSDHLPQAEGPLLGPPAYQPSRVYARFKDQAWTSLRALVEQAEAHGGPMLAITHGGLIKTMLRLVVGSDAVCFKLYNTGLSLIEWRQGRWYLVHLNLWDHLPTDLRTS